MSEKNQGYLSGVLAVLIWSGFILASRAGGTSLLTEFDVIALRYTTCAVILFPLWALKFRFNLLNARLLILSLIGGLCYALLAFSGFKSTPASHAAVLLPGLMPFFITILSVWLINTGYSLTKWIGLTIVSVGIWILLWEETTDNTAISHGHSLIVGAAICWAMYSVLLSRWQITPWQATVSLAIITCCIYLPVYLLWLPSNISHAPMSDIVLQVVYQGILATIVQMLLYVRAVQIIGPGPMGMMMALVPLLAGFAAIPVFSEPLTKSFLLAVCLVVMGLCISNTNQQVFSNVVLSKFRKDVRNSIH